jgi:hypothetical protein
MLLKGLMGLVILIGARQGGKNAENENKVKPNLNAFITLQDWRSTGKHDINVSRLSTEVR